MSFVYDEPRLVTAPPMTRYTFERLKNLPEDLRNEIVTLHDKNERIENIKYDIKIIAYRDDSDFEFFLKVRPDIRRNDKVQKLVSPLINDFEENFNIEWLNKGLSSTPWHEDNPGYEWNGILNFRTSNEPSKIIKVFEETFKKSYQGEFHNIIVEDERTKGNFIYNFILF